MKAVTRKALNGSILKWKKIKDGTGEDEGLNNCPLCFRFYNNNDTPGYMPSCSGKDDERCPVSSAGYEYCAKSPYTAWSKHQNEHTEEDRENDKDIGGNWPWKIREGCQKCKELADAEYQFLKSLPPKRKGKKK